MNFHKILHPLLRERKFRPQDGLQNGPRSAQDGPKRLLKRNFFDVENRLNFGLVLDPILVGFDAPKGVGSLGVWTLTFFGHVNLVACGSPLRRPKRSPRALQTPPRAPQEFPRGGQEHPRRLQEGLKRPQEPVKRPQNPLKSSQEHPKTPKRFFRSTWLGSRFRKIHKI